ncbi:hypothetical protein TNCT_405941 [Trichonephila clavata]|uniref:Uncharacterized protein n=1 Tax=Trichonephila clavata TaxID=2740835 RepID=A0A8X6GTU8_TRICU|nr:hypothetical protein TNCT_405941 [Trichonephila clavata]
MTCSEYIATYAERALTTMRMRYLSFFYDTMLQDTLLYLRLVRSHMIYFLDLITVGSLLLLSSGNFAFSLRRLMLRRLSNLSSSLTQ